MTISLSPIATVNGLKKAADSVLNGFNLEVNKIEVGRGFQEILVDEEGRALTTSLAQPVGMIGDLAGTRIGVSQWNFTINLVGLSESPWYLTELRLIDSDGEVLAILGSKETRFIEVSDVFENLFINFDMVFGSYPADSIIIKKIEGSETSLFTEDFTTGIIRNSNTISKRYFDLEKRISDLEKAKV